jgi:hypothetical protein
MGEGGGEGEGGGGRKRGEGRGRGKEGRGWGRGKDGRGRGRVLTSPQSINHFMPPLVLYTQDNELCCPQPSMCVCM